jgi:hypothetical protein
MIKRLKKYLYLQLLLPYLYGLGAMIISFWPFSKFHHWGIGIWALTWLAVFLFLIKVVNLRWSKIRLHAVNPQLAEGLELLEKNESGWILEKWLKNLSDLNLKLDFRPFLYLFILGFLSLSLFWVLKPQPENSSVSANSKVKLDQKLNPSLLKPLITVKIVAPAYTGIATITSSSLDIKAAEGSKIYWQINGENLAEYDWFLEEAGKKRTFTASKKDRVLASSLNSNTLYRIGASKGDKEVWSSAYYSLESIPDQKPVLNIDSKEYYKELKGPNLGTEKLRLRVSDDYAVKQILWVGTIAKGNGENIKFREKQAQVFNGNAKSLNMTYSIDLEKLGLEVGEELYFYFLVADSKQPEAHVLRSETFFIKYLDPKQLESLDASTMAVNNLPEYFRSQRQIIIDTEKLIKARKKTKIPIFQEKSNELGFDQKSLRLRYGQYLGEEFESSVGPGSKETEDLLEGFKHDHDHEEQSDHHHAEEATEYAHDHEHQQESSSETDPLATLMADYVHAHDDGELNTYYEASTRSLLKSALEQMWQSELYLRLYEPEKALPFEQKALEYLKKAQQKARNYAQKTAISVAPIKENETRLKGRAENLSKSLKFQSLTEARITEKALKQVLGHEPKAVLSSASRQALIYLAAYNGLGLASRKTCLSWANTQFLEFEDLRKLKSEIAGLVYILNSRTQPKSASKSYQSLKKAYLNSTAQ